MVKLFERMLEGKTDDDMLTPIACAFIAQLRTEVSRDGTSNQRK
jgi:hypothetical protein